MHEEGGVRVYAEVSAWWEWAGGDYATKSIWPNFCFMAVQFCVPDVMPSLPFWVKGAAAVIFMRGVLQQDLMA